MEVKDLCAVVAETGKEILTGFNLIVRAGEVFPWPLTVPQALPV